MYFLPLGWTLLDRAVKAGKTDLNGGTPKAFRIAGTIGSARA